MQDFGKGGECAVQLKELKGLGPKRLKDLAEAGLDTPAELLWRFPGGYIDSTKDTPAGEAAPGRAACFSLTFLGAPTLRYLRGLSMVTAEAEDETGLLRLVWFNQPWMRNQYRKGDSALFYGRPELVKGRLTINNPKPIKERGIIAQYAPVGGITGSLYSSLIDQLLPELETLAPETMPENLLRQWELCGLHEALKEVHRPTDGEALRRAKRRVAFENLLLYQLALRSLRGESEAGPVITGSNALLADFWRGTGFEPTGAQRKVLGQIVCDLASGKAMRRLVQGDVGSGKTAIALAAAALAAKGGYQTALMAPTEILARQHLESAQRLLAPLGVRCGLLLGGMKAAERREALDSIACGGWDLVIGTQALFSAGVEYHRLALVITDEQHRFGVRQRKLLSEKALNGQEAHVLVMSATPIPRTLALMLYGDLDLSVVDELPPGRTPVKTRVVAESKRADMYRFIRREVEAGRQAYLVCPLVMESEAVEAENAQDMYEKLKSGPLKGLALGLTWGSQPGEEKERVISAFSKGEVSVLVATTVIEVGVNVPKASVMVIENANRFGLSQLHQLRGRVGRGADESWCFLMGESNERLQTLCATNDGFAVAQKDLELRGPGDFLGTRQSGRLTPDGFGVEDILLIEETHAAAAELSLRAELQKEARALTARALKKYEKALQQVALN